MLPFPSTTTSEVPPTTATPTAMFPAFASASAVELIMDFAVSSMLPVLEVRLLFFTRTTEDAFPTLTATPMPIPFVFIFRVLPDVILILSAVRLLSSISTIVSIFFTLARKLPRDATPLSTFCQILVSAEAPSAAVVLSASEEAVLEAEITMVELPLLPPPESAMIVIFRIPTYLVSESYTFLTTLEKTSLAEPLSLESSACKVSCLTFRVTCSFGFNSICFAISSTIAWDRSSSQFFPEARSFLKLILSFARILRLVIPVVLV